MKNARLILLMMLIPFTTFAGDLTFQDWDSDNDGFIEKHEFTSKFIDEFYNSWVPTAKKGILEEGFFKNSYAGLDTDNDNELSDEEWLIGYNYFYDDYIVYDGIDYVDLNSDGIITYNEYYDVLYETSYFTDIDLDADNFVSEYELAEFVFNNWDLNDSGVLSRSEYQRFDWYYLDV